MTIATDLERYMVELVNQERTSRGLDALQIKQNLSLAADRHSEWMSDADSFSHQGSGQSTATERMLEAGMDLSGSWGTAENIAAAPVYGTDSYRDEIDTLHQGLMDSPGHRANILNPDLEYIGIGIALGPLTFGSNGSFPTLLVTQNFSYTGGDVDLDLVGDNGANMLVGGTGDDALNGGLGHDTLEGGSGNDRLEGNNGFDVIRGGDGNDIILGGSLGDRLWGDNGNDTVDGGFGRDTAYLGNGNDVYNDNGQGGWLGGDRVFAGNGNDRVNGGGGSDSFFGGNGNDLIYGGNGDDTLNGGSGGDRIFAGNNNDIVDGGFGRDTAFLGNGNDVYNDNGQTSWFGDDRILGGGGDDTITSSGGDDIVTGGAGSDVFIFAGSTIENDTVTDYQTGTDALHLDATLWGGGMSEEEVIAQFATAADGNTVFDFGSGNTITLSGVKTTAGLIDDLVII